MSTVVCGWKSIGAAMKMMHDVGLNIVVITDKLI
jgi:hypothetical protein